MKHLLKSIYMLLFLILLVPRTSSADVKIISGTLERGVKLCKSGNFSKGIDTIIDAAMELRREAPRHPLNNQWRAKMRFCFNRWLGATERSCKRNNKVEAYEALLSVKKKASLIASKGTKRKIETTIRGCVNSLKRNYQRRCKKDGAVVSSLKRLASLLSGDPKNQRKVRGILGECLKFQWKKGIERCHREFSIQSLKHIFTLNKIIPQNRVVAQQYQGCLVAQATGARNMCRAMQFSKGQRLMKKSAYLLKHATPVNRAALQSVSAMKDECGLYTIDFAVTMSGVSGGVWFSLPVTSRLVVVKRADGKGVKACGKLTFGRNSVTRGRCTAFVTVPSPKSHWVCFSGSLKPQRRKRYPQLRLSFDTTLARTLVRESIQSSCRGKAPVIFKEKLFELLLNKKDMRLQMTAIGSEKRLFRIAKDAGGGRKVVFKGSFTLHYY